jgi:hypothetical protein
VQRCRGPRSSLTERRLRPEAAETMAVTRL